jgi:hypothetical protein
MFEVPATRGIIHESARKRGMSHGYCRYVLVNV